MEQDGSISMQQLKQENYQLKNEISEMKNAFDLNRDILAILSAQNKNNNVDIKIFYQIIRRLTTFNNQTIVNFGDLVSQKANLKAQNMKLKRQNELLSETVQQLLNDSKQNKIRQAHFQMKKQSTLLHKELINMNRQLATKQQDIKRLKKKLKQKVQEMAPIELISTSTQDSLENEIMGQSNTNFNKNSIFVELEYYKKKNKQLTFYIQQLQARIDLLSKCVKLQQNKTPQTKAQQDLLLSLMNFAIQNMRIKSLNPQHINKIKVKPLKNWAKTQKKKAKSMEKFS